MDGRLTRKGVEVQERKQGHLEADERVLDGDRELFSLHAGWSKPSVSHELTMLFSRGGTHTIGANRPRQGSKRQSLATFREFESAGLHAARRDRPTKEKKMMPLTERNCETIRRQSTRSGMNGLTTTTMPDPPWASDGTASSRHWWRPKTWRGSTG